MSDTRVTPVLTKLTACVQTELEAAEIAVCGVFYTSGQAIALDQPQGKSIAWVRLVNIAGTEPDGTGAVCGAAWQLDVEVGIAHCWPLQENPLTDLQHLGVAVKVNDSMAALHKAIACCTTWHPKGRRTVTVTRWQPIGPQGGVIGGAWLLQVRV